MKKPKTEQTLKYRVLKGIESDALGERYEPDQVVDLSHWPHDVINLWLKQGVLEKVKEEKPAEEEVDL